MSKSTIGFVQHTKKERDKIGLSLQQADDLLQKQLVPITRMRRSLHSASTLFKGKDDILPVQCKRVIASLEKLDANIQQFCELLDDAADLPSAYRVLRYRLTSVLYLLEEQVGETSDLIDSFRDICLTSSSAIRRQRREISTSLETLLAYIDDISLQAESLNYEGHRLQRKLLLVSQEELDADCESNSVPSQSKLHVIK